MIDMYATPPPRGRRCRVARRRWLCDLPVETVPADGRHEGAVFEVIIEDDEIATLAYRPDTEADRREAMQDRFDRLSKRLDEE